MSLEELRSDLKANIIEFDSVINDPALTVGSLARHIKNTLWPFLDSCVEQLEDIDESVAEMYENATDMLQPETGAVFAAVITGGTGIADELAKRLGSTLDDERLKKAIREYKRMAAQAAEILAEIVVAPAEDEDEDEEDPEDETDDDQEVSDEH